MIIGTGIDLVQIPRIEKAIARFGDKFLRRILTENERQRSTSAAYVARRFATKEAAAKALGTGIGQFAKFHDIETVHDDLGKPSLVLHGAAKEKFPHMVSHVSVSDDYPHATAMVILESRA